MPQVIWPEEAPWPERPLLAARLGKLALLAVGVTALVAAHVPVCPFALATGQPCPGCGLTRATLACLRGDIAGGAHLHPLVFLATPAAVALLVLAVYSYLKVGKARYSPSVMRWLLPPLKVIYVALLVLWVVRFAGYFGGPVKVQSIIGYALSLRKS